MEQLDKNTQVCLALGFFDSVHTGHKQVIKAAFDYARSHGIASAVATFSNNPYKQFNPDDKLIYTFAERETLFQGLVDFVAPMRFDASFKKSSAIAFLERLIVKYNIKALVCGYDYTFGEGASGDTNLLKSWCAAHKIDCIVVEEYDFDGDRVSSSLIKKLITNGKIEHANLLLSSPFFITGRVVHGRGVGRMFDIPTANVKIHIDKLLPKVGVYATKTEVGGKKYYSVTNVGGRPTFDLSRVVVESMLDDFNDNIYDQPIKIEFIKRLRDNVKFDSPALLSAQVHKDIKWYKD